MGAEVHVPARALAVRFNGAFSPTDRGHLAHELVRIDRVLRTIEMASVRGSAIQFGMSKEMTQRYRERREELCESLHLSQNEKNRRKSIKRFDKKLTEVGFPYYKIKI